MSPEKFYGRQPEITFMDDASRRLSEFFDRFPDVEELTVEPNQESTIPFNTVKLSRSHDGDSELHILCLLQVLTNEREETVLTVYHDIDTNDVSFRYGADTPDNEPKSLDLSPNLVKLTLDGLERMDIHQHITPLGQSEPTPPQA